MLANSQVQHELNDYQQLMYKISKLTPYNAVHAVKLNPGQKDLTRLRIDLQTAINLVLADLAIGEPYFSTNKKKVQFKRIENGLPLQTSNYSLLEHAHLEMNRAFQDHETPLRFFLLSVQNQWYLSITYDHWVTDAFGIHQLITAILSYAEHKTPIKLILSAPHMKTCYPSTYGYKAPYYRMRGLVQTMQQFSSAYRTPIAHGHHIETGVQSYIFAPKLLDMIKNHCKIKKISLNDFFISILAQLFGKLSQEERAQCQRKWFKPKRDRIVIGVIANIRPQSRLPLDTIFSLFLGFFYLSFKAPERQTFAVLSQAIHAQTLNIKKHNRAVKHTLLLKLQNWCWDFKKTPQGKFRLFSKNIPLTVGISNMNMDATTSLVSAEIEHYIRFSPTAILCPIIFNLTTLNQRLSLAISFRKQCYSDEKIHLILSTFIHNIYTEISNPSNS